MVTKWVYRTFARLPRSALFFLVNIGRKQRINGFDAFPSITVNETPSIYGNTLNTRRSTYFLKHTGRPHSAYESHRNCDGCIGAVFATNWLRHGGR